MKMDEKLEKEREERRKLFLSWDIENDLPCEVGDYVLKRIDFPTMKDRKAGKVKTDIRVYTAFAWENEKNGWMVKAIFDEETKDYMVKMDLRLMTLTQLESITGDFEQFKKRVRELTPKAIEKELIHLERVSVLAAAKGFMKWDYEKVMPERMGQYKRIIKPVNPVEGLNGSFIIGAYECRERNIGVLFFYNIYREEYYGELRAGGIPVIVHQYDATTINEFSSHLEAYLEKDLETLYENPVVED